MAQAEIDHPAMIGGVDRRQLGMRGDARIARRGVERFEPRRLRQPPGKRMFAAAGAEQQDIHERFSPRRRDSEARRSEEHTSELQSLMRISYAVFCLQKK